MGLIVVLVALFAVVGGGHQVFAVVTSPSGPTGQLTYVPLAPLPGITADVASNLPAYLIQIFKLAIGLAAALAVVMITWGGFQYMSTDAISGKSEGKEKIEQALVGLLLAICSWLILNTINPALTTFKFNPPPPAASSDTVPPSVVRGYFAIDSCIKEKRIPDPPPATSYTLRTCTTRTYKQFTVRDYQTVEKARNACEGSLPNPRTILEPTDTCTRENFTCSSNEPGGSVVNPGDPQSTDCD